MVVEEKSRREKAAQEKKVIIQQHTWKDIIGLFVIALI